MPKGWVPEVCVSYDVLTTYISEQSDGGLSSEFRNVAWLFVWGFGFFLCGVVVVKEGAGRCLLVLVLFFNILKGTDS